LKLSSAAQRTPNVATQAAPATGSYFAPTDFAVETTPVICARALDEQSLSDDA
jgi:hypothetical protein